jgi:uncharacterized protein DUF6665
VTTLPRPVMPQLPVDNPTAALDYEIAREKASALGRLGRRLEGALAALAAFDAQTGESPMTPAQRRERRDALVAEAGYVLWSFIVQREACGLHDGNRAMRDYGVPNEVRVRMGVLPAGKGRPAGSRR